MGKIEMRKVLITGAAGFIGSHLCDIFVKKGYYTIGIDNFITGSPENISHIKNQSNFEFIKQDIIKSNSVEEISHHIEGKIDLILHFASPASPVDYINHPLETMKVNSIGTLNMLDLACKNKSRYLLASTSEVYGDPNIHPQIESYWGNVNPVGPRSVYDEAKRFSEAISFSYYKEFGLDARIIRIFNTYGPRMKANDGRVIPQFITQALNGEKITVYGNGSQTRSFCYVDDLIDGIYLFSTKENLQGEIINMGNHHESSILELANLILDKTSSKSQIIFKPLPEDDPQQRCPDITKINKLISWQPQIDLEDGIEKTINFFSTN
jgi:dTDP-glucose 4,6-dehydratase